MVQQSSNLTSAPSSLPPSSTLHSLSSNLALTRLLLYQMAQVQLSEMEIFNRELIRLNQMRDFTRGLRGNADDNSDDDEEFPVNPPSSRIRLRVFMELPRDLVLEYAKHHKIPNAPTLSSKEIYMSIQRKTNREVQPLPHHVKYPTETGFVVARTHDDLIAWLDAHESLNLDPVNWSEDEENEDYVPFETLDDEVHTYCRPPSPPPSSLPNLITLRELCNQYIGPAYTNRFIDLASSLGFEAKSHKDTMTQLFDLSMKLLAGCAGSEVARLVAGAASSFGRAYLAAAASGSDGPSSSSSLKRSRSDDDVEGNNGDEEEEGTSTTRKIKRARQSQTSDDNDNDNSNSSSSFHRPFQLSNCKWSEYICDDESDAGSDVDSTYSPSLSSSSDNEDSDSDSPANLTRIERWEIREYELGRVKTDQGYISGDLSDSESVEELEFESEEDNDADDEEDSDYVPPKWTFEDVLEITNEPEPKPTDGSKFKSEASIQKYDNKLRVYHLNELLDTGYMSDAKLSSSSSALDVDVDESSASASDSQNANANANENEKENLQLQDRSTLWRTFSRLDVPENLKTYTALPPYLRPNRDPNGPLVDLRLNYPPSSKYGDFYRVEARRLRRKAGLEGHGEGQGEGARRGGSGLSLDAALDVVLGGNERREYAFDNREWRAFEELTNANSDLTLARAERAAR